MENRNLAVDSLAVLVNHILAMKGDPYLEGHPEWCAIYDQTEKIHSRVFGLTRKESLNLDTADLLGMDWWQQAQATVAAVDSLWELNVAQEELWDLMNQMLKARGL